MAQVKSPAFGAQSSLAMSDDLPAPQAIELRHLRYFAAVADAGSFTHAAEKMFIAQPTLSQQVRRLEQIVGTPLLQRRRTCWLSVGWATNIFSAACVKLPASATAAK